VWTLELREVLAYRMEVLNGPFDATRDDHGSRLAADLLESYHLLKEVIDHDFGLEPDRVLMALDIPPELLLRPLGVELGIALDGLHEPVVAVDGRVVLQNVEDEALVDCLLHRVGVEGAVL